MKKAMICLLVLACMLLVVSCNGAGERVVYETEHTHVYGYWYDTEEPLVQVRYCRICQKSETQRIEKSE